MLILFDFDGTLVNNHNELYERYCEICKHLNVKPRGIERLFGMINDCHDFWDLHENISEEDMKPVFKKIGPSKYKPRTDVKKLFDHLHKNGHKIGILTSRDNSVQHYIDEFGIRDKLDIIKTFEEVHVKKPDPAVFDPIFEEGFDAGNVVYVGDALADKQAAEEAGVRFVGIVSNLNSHDRFLEEGVEKTHIIYSLTEIINLLKELE